MNSSDATRIKMLIIGAFAQHSSQVSVPICINIYRRAFVKVVGQGRSTYARKRRALSIGRCHRCYRVYPPLPFSKKCDNRTCVPGISYNVKVANYILWGVTEVIPHPGYNF
ncbi:nucleic acid binding protein [Atractylodes mottle virus]|uniref:RNA silencing suppressor n=1 Tax=Atractylodes mottle virus TaxID=1702121 RepID=A0A0K2BN41_9VIRU|nr:nucleic acid binding protein [Atractylodes mottle virus]AKZ66619.1 nucleic acid binding protein [Atractylodes mottle virus]